MNYKKYTIYGVLPLLITLIAFQNCTKPSDFSDFENSTNSSIANDENPGDDNYVSGPLDLQIYTAPSTFLDVGETFIIVAKELSGYSELSYVFRKNSQLIGSRVYFNGSQGQTLPLVLEDYADKDSYSLDIFQEDTLLYSRLINLNVHEPEPEPEPDDSACAKPNISIHNNIAVGGYILTWTQPAEYSKIRLMNDKSNANIIPTYELQAAANYTQIYPSSGNIYNKSSIKYQIETTCEDGSISYSNILTLNIN